MAESNTCELLVAVLVVALLAVFVYYSGWFGEQRGSCPTADSGSRERYGPPPGMVRALSHNELPDDRGWPGMDKVYNANTASSISHMIERG
jgi:hypothetical protein